MSKRKLVCMCENEFEVDVPDVVDLSENPEVRDDILKGNFMSYTCPKCGKLLKPEFPFLLLNSGDNVNIFFIPELDRGSYFRGRLEYTVSEEANRIVIGFAELIEKLSILDFGLDDRVIESVKMYLLEKAVNGNQDTNMDDRGYKELIPRVWFDKKTERELIFKIEGLKNDSIALAKIPIETYERFVGELDNKKNKLLQTILSPPYVSVNKLSWE